MRFLSRSFIPPRGGDNGHSDHTESTMGTGHNRTPAVSVVMPVYNGARTLRSAIDSVLAQSFQDFEFIIVDDASTDSSAEIVQSYGPRIHFIRRPVNSGICEVARSQGLELAQGRYSALIDQDDLWEPAKLERQVAFMESHPDIPLCHTYAWVIDSDGHRIEIRNDGKIPPTGPCARELLRHCFITISTIMVRGRAWLDAGNASKLKEANSDFLYFFSILQQSPAGFGFIPEPLTSYRRWPMGMSQGRWKWGPEDVPGLTALARSGLWKGLLSRREVLDAIATACRTNAEHYFYENRPGCCAYYAAWGWRYRPLDLRFPTWLLKAGGKALLRPAPRLPNPPVSP